METKTLSVITSISMVFTITAAALGIIGLALTGLYPGIFVLFLIALIPIASKLYTKKVTSKPNDFQRPYFTPLAIVNVLSILVVIWMSFVILIERVLSQIL